MPYITEVVHAEISPGGGYVYWRRNRIDTVDSYYCFDPSLNGSYLDNSLSILIFSNENGALAVGRNNIGFFQKNGPQKPKRKYR